jgi:hypothetical protein
MSTPKKEYITATMARWAAGLTFEQLPREVVHHAKRFLLDSLGCAVGGYLQHDVRIALEVLEETAGRGPATVIGSGRRIDPVSAAVANALMVRVMDYNDIYWKQDPSHPSDIIPAALACGELAGSGGRELIVGIVLGHEFEQRLCEAAFPGIRERGWHHATLTAFVSPLVAGRMLRLSWEQLQHAIGISASRHATLGVVTAGRLTMMKNTVDPMATQSGVLAALLAERGYTGPEHVVDGKEGLAHCLGPEWKLEVLTAGLGRLPHHSCGMKAYPPRRSPTRRSRRCSRSSVSTTSPSSREGPHPLAGPRRRHPRGPLEVRPAHQGDRRPLAALRDRRGAGRPPGHAAPVHRRQDPRPAHPRPTAQGRGGRRPGERAGVPGAPEGDRDDPHHRRRRAHQPTTPGRPRNPLSGRRSKPSSKRSRRAC